MWRRYNPECFPFFFRHGKKPKSQVAFENTWMKRGQTLPRLKASQSHYDLRSQLVGVFGFILVEGAMLDQGCFDTTKNHMILDTTAGKRNNHNNP